MTPLQAIAVLAVGFIAGAINTIVGSGTLLTFPTLIAVGYSPVVANVSNTVGLWPGSVSGAVGYRAELRGQRNRSFGYGIATTVGAIIGGTLLLTLPGSVFESAVPLLILLACILMAAQPYLTKRLHSNDSAGRGRIAVLWFGVLLTGIYGGYFGAAQGVILIALLGILLGDDLQRMNGLKNVLAALANVVAAILFVIFSHVAWLPAILIAVSSVVGAQVGAKIGRRIPAQGLRWTVVVVGVAVAIILWIRR